ncbi:MAG: methyltransferase domain-containing protein [Acidobacteriota bacterium]|nr:methyltransferase domain-containing protein [Acidobacteriota bacterium]
MTREIDLLTSPTLKYLREQWWNPAFSEFLREVLNPRPGRRLLDVGCGAGTAEIGLGVQQLSQVRFFGVDRDPVRAREALADTASLNIDMGVAAGDALRLPFRAASFDAVFCVAVLQHVPDLSGAVAEFARVVRPGGRVVAVEPDNSARYWYSSCETGMQAFDLGRRFQMALAQATGGIAEAGVGPRVSAMFVRHGVTPTAVRLFPVSVARLGSPDSDIWAARQEAIRAQVAACPDEALRRLGSDYLKAIDRYADEAAAAGPAFVEIQNTLLMATVGQRAES